MNNVCEMIKPDLFVCSNDMKVALKIRAMYMLESKELPKTNKNMKKYSDRMLKEEVCRKKNTTISGFQYCSVTLKCSVTNKEVGYYLKTSFRYWDSLSIVFVKEEFRGLGMYKRLVSHYERNSNKVSLIELKRSDAENIKHIYKEWGYDKTLDGFLPTNIALIKDGSFGEFKKAYELEMNDMLNKRYLRFEGVSERVKKTVKHCHSITDILSKRKELLKIFNEVQYEFENYLEYEMEVSDEGSAWHRFIQDYYYQMQKRTA